MMKVVQNRKLSNKTVIYMYIAQTDMYGHLCAHIYMYMYMYMSVWAIIILYYNLRHTCMWACMMLHTLALWAIMAGVLHV